MVAVVGRQRAVRGGDRFLMDIMRNVRAPRVLALNKADLWRRRRCCRACGVSRAPGFADIVPVSALTGENLDRLEQVLLSHLPEGEPLYPEDFLTDQPDGSSWPSSCANRCCTRPMTSCRSRRPSSWTSSRKDRGLLHLYCTILVERDSQKPILIGKGGAAIKSIGTAAREELERFFQTRCSSTCT